LQHGLQQLLEPLQELLFLHFEDAAPFAQAAGDSLSKLLEPEGATVAKISSFRR
jgi:hypothetical protein